MLKGRKVLVTGADGFIGSHLVERLVGEGGEVTAFVYYNVFGHWGWLDESPPDVRKVLRVIPGDIRDSLRVREAVQGQEIVFHLAALIGIPYSYHAPESYVATNVQGTLNVLQAAREAGCRRVCVTSTSEVYGTAQTVPIDEGHPRQGQSPYSASKIGADVMAEAYFRSFGVPVVTVRPFNTYGPRQSSRAVIPTIMTQLLAGQEIIRLGDLRPRRDLVFVDDTVEGFLRLAECDQAVGQDVNMATGKDISIGELVELIFEVSGCQAEIVTEKERIRPEKSEVMRLCGSAERLESLTGWRPRTPLEEGLRKTWEWFSRHENRSRYKEALYHV